MIGNLSKNKKKFINYRDSKLTRLLQPSLSGFFYVGNASTSIICTISLEESNYFETINTILFGGKAKNIKVHYHVNEIPQDPTVEKALEEIKNLKNQIQAKKEEEQKAKVNEAEVKNSIKKFIQAINFTKKISPKKVINFLEETLEKIQIIFERIVEFKTKLGNAEQEIQIQKIESIRMQVISEEAEETIQKIEGGIRNLINWVENVDNLSLDLLLSKLKEILTEFNCNPYKEYNTKELFNLDFPELFHDNNPLNQDKHFQKNIKYDRKSDYKEKIEKLEKAIIDLNILLKSKSKELEKSAKLIEDLQLELHSIYSIANSSTNFRNISNMEHTQMNSIPNIPSKLPKSKHLSLQTQVCNSTNVNIPSTKNHLESKEEVNEKLYLKKNISDLERLMRKENVNTLNYYKKRNIKGKNHSKKVDSKFDVYGNYYDNKILLNQIGNLKDAFEKVTKELEDKNRNYIELEEKFIKLNKNKNSPGFQEINISPQSDNFIEKKRKRKCRHYYLRSKSKKLDYVCKVIQERKEDLCNLSDADDFFYSSN